MPGHQPKQLSLIAGTWTKDRFAFGGSLLKNSHAKFKRHFVRKLPLHVVLRSSAAKGERSLLRHNRAIQKILREQCARNSVTMHNGANAGNHLHLLLEAPSRARISAFLRAISGRIAMAVTGARKSSALGKNFWDARPFSRIVSRGRDLRNVGRYLAMNSTETAGFSRPDARRMFRRIQDLLAAGALPRRPSLSATGFV